MVGVEILKSVLPNTILDEIFHLSSRVNDIVIDYLCSDLEQCGYNVRNVHNFDHSIIIDLEVAGIYANVRIDRILKTFEVVAKVSDYTILPRNSDWNGILEYLVCLCDNNDC